MKKAWIVLLSIILLFLFGAAADASAQELYGGKDTPSAVVIPSSCYGQTLIGFDDVKKAYRYYSIIAEEESDLTITLYATEKEVTLQVYDINGKSVFEKSAKPTDANNIVVWSKRVYAGETFSFKVYIPYVSSSNSGNYEFTVDCVPAEAPFLLLGGSNTKNATILKDEDYNVTRLGYDDSQKNYRYYKVTAEEESDLTITVCATEKEVTLLVYDIDGNLIFEKSVKPADANNTIVWSKRVYAGETFSFEIYIPYVNSSTNFGRYELTVDRVPATAPFLLLGGSNTKNATVLKNDDCNILHLGYDNSQKNYRYYSVTADEESDLTITARATEHETELVIYDVNGSQLADISARPTDMNNAVAWSKRLSAGETISFRIYIPYVNNSSNNGNYEFNVEKLPAEAPFLLTGGKNFREAAEITPEQFAVWHLGYDDSLKANRCYKVTPSQDGTLSLTVYAVSGEQLFSFYDANGDRIKIGSDRTWYTKAGLTNTVSLAVKGGETIYIQQEMDNYSREHYYHFCICCDGVHGDSGDWVTTAEPGCVSEGLRARYCMICNGVTEEESIPSIGHTVGESRVTQEATCKQEGEMTVFCAVCGEPINKQTLPMAAHTYGDMTIITPATCTTDGLGEQRCLVCYTLLNSEIVPKTGHNAEVWTTLKQTTCTSEGNRVSRCTVCGETLATETIPPLGHDGGEWVTLRDATCTSEGTRIKRCTICGETLGEETLPALGHSIGDWKKIREVSCAQTGLKQKICVHCGYVAEEETTEKLPHEYSGWTVLQEATKESVGSQTRYCLICGEIEYDTIPKIEKFLGIF